MSTAGEVLVLPFHSKGHTFPAIELSRHLAARNLAVTLFLPSLPRSPLHDNVRILQFAGPPPPPPGTSSTGPFPPPLPHPGRRPAASPPSPPPHLHRDASVEEYPGRRSDASAPPPPPHLHRDASVEEYLARRAAESRPLLCAIVDEMMSSYMEFCESLGVPVVCFFTSSACAAAVEHAASKFSEEDFPPDGALVAVPGIPQDMALTASDLRPDPPPHGSSWPPPPPPLGRNRIQGGGAAPPPPRGLRGTSSAAALLFNTCDAVERPFLDYVGKEFGKPVWGVGPLLPPTFWSEVHVKDDEARLEQGEQPAADGEIRAWLDAKPPGSVVYVSFGTLMPPAESELEELAAGLEESRRPFIWALPAGGFSPEKKSELGLVIRGWAPQLMILSHPSTALFVSHCGWNSTAEALTRGVPILAWPIKGDQIFNAKLVTARLGVGHPVRAAGWDQPVNRGDVARAIERLVSDRAVKDRAAAVRAIFDAGFPSSSVDSLDRLVDFIFSPERLPGSRV